MAELSEQLAIFIVFSPFWLIPALVGLIYWLTGKVVQAEEVEVYGSHYRNTRDVRERFGR